MRRRNEVRFARFYSQVYMIIIVNIIKIIKWRRESKGIKKKYRSIIGSTVWMTTTEYDYPYR